MKFGKTQTTELIDDEGSTKTLENIYRDGAITKPRRLRFEIRHRTDKTDLETISQIAHELITDPAKLDTAIKFERSKNGEHDGYHHIIECYTLLEY